MATKEQIKEAGKPNMVFFWRKIYNILCRSCQRKVFLAGTTKGDSPILAMADFMETGICKGCNKRKERMLINYEKRKDKK